jgi:hypothetical protein
LTFKIKDALFFVFKEHKIPPIPLIDSNLKDSDIRKWKDNPIVKNCYEKLFKKIKHSEHETFMSKVIQRLRKTRKDLTKEQIAYSISVCELLLNPENSHIQAAEPSIKPLLVKNLVSILVFT